MHGALHESRIQRHETQFISIIIHKHEHKSESGSKACITCITFLRFLFCFFFSTLFPKVFPSSCPNLFLFLPGRHHARGISQKLRHLGRQQRQRYSPPPPLSPWSVCQFVNPVRYFASTSESIILIRGIRLKGGVISLRSRNFQSSLLGAGVVGME